MKYTSYKNANIFCLPGEKAVKATYTDINGQKHDCYVIARRGREKRANITMLRWNLIVARGKAQRAPKIVHQERSNAKMITKISNGIVTVEPYGFSPGTYPIEEFTADDLQEERRILGTYCQAHNITGDVFRKLDDQIARAIDDKCNKSIE